MNAQRPPPLHQQVTRRRLLVGMLAGGLPWTSPAIAANAACRDMRVFTPNDATPLKPLLQALKQRCPNLLLDSEATTADNRRASVQLALGPQALRKALAGPSQTPLISALTSSLVLKRQLNANPHDAGQITGIHAEAAPLAQMQLIAALFERKVTVGVLLSEASAHLERVLRQAGQTQGLDIQTLTVPPDQDPARMLNGLQSVQVLLAVPDGTLYTPDNLRAVLEATYRRGIPVIGFSQATVTAGTLACAYADLDDVTPDLLDLIDALPVNGPLPEPRYPRYWRVAINDSVARSLGLSITDRVRNLGSRPAGRTP